MIDVYWFEQRTTDVPDGDKWLSGPELDCLRPTATLKRRADWRLGRWTAKQSAAMYFNLPRDPASLERIRIVPAPGGAPQLFYDNEPLNATISISHADSAAVCAITRAGVDLGCDMEIVERRTPAFESDYFTPTEWCLLAEAPTVSDRDGVLAAIWSAKESVLKAVREGLRIDARSVVVDFEVGGDPSRWRPLQAVFRRARTFSGWWRMEGRMVRTVTSSPPCERPVEISMIRPFTSVQSA